jgi:dipeptidyl aminopeptidase/acylaminoacyl peptidase
MRELEGTPPWPSERPKLGWTRPASTVEAKPAGTREEIRAWLHDNALESNPTMIDRLAFQDELSLRGEMEFGHLFLIDVEDEAAQPRQLTTGFFTHDDAVFMPDGRSVMYVSSKAIDQHPDRVLTADIWRIDLDGRNDRKIVSIDGFRLRRPRPISDGSVIAFLGESMAEPAYGVTRLGLAPATAEAPLKPEWLTDVTSFDVLDCQWIGGKAALVFTAAQRGGFPLMTISAGLPEPVTLVEKQDDLPVGVHAFDVGGGTIVYSQCAVSSPSVLRLRDAAGNDRAILDLNPWIADKNLSRPSPGEITRPDGMRVQYWLMEPTSRERG